MIEQTPPMPSDPPCHAEEELTGREHLLKLPEFALEGGTRLAEVTVAWQHIGQAPTNDNVILLLHGISGSHQACHPENAPAYSDAGWGGGWIGPGKALDTERYCILVPNTLGSCFGTTGPRSLDAALHRPYGREFPANTIGDAVRLQGCWLQALGLERVHAVIGYSYGGYQAFEWALSGPLACGRAVALASSFKGRGQAQDIDQLGDMAAGWLGSPPGQRWSAQPKALNTWLQQRLSTLKHYGYPAWHWESEKAALIQQAEIWANEFDPLSLRALRRAAIQFDAGSQIAALSIPFLWAACDSDTLFPSDALALQAAGLPLEFHAVDGQYGHASPILEAARWTPAVKQFLDSRR